MTIPVRPEPEDPVAAYKRKYGTAPPAPRVRSFAAEGTAVAPDQAGRRAAMAAAPPILSSGLARELEQGATFGFGDEINAGARSLFTDQSFQDALANERATMHTYEQAHPVVSLGAQFAGGAATGVGISRALPVAASSGSALVRGAKVVGAGAGYGAAAGAGNAEGDLSDRARGAVRGAEAGAVIAPVVAGVGLGARKLLAPYLSRAIDASGVRAPAGAVAPMLDDRAGVELTLPQRTARRVGVRSVQDRADNLVLNTIEKGGKSIDDVRAEAAAASPDKPVTLADLGGEGTRALVRGARGFAESGASTRVPAIVRGRAERAGARMSEDMTRASGVQPVDPYDLADRMRTAQQTQANDLYKAAYSKGAVSDETVDKMLTLPYFSDAYKFAKNLAKLDGRDLPERLSYVVEPPKVPPTPPGFSDDQWADAVAMMRKQGIPVPHSTGDLAVRDRFGQLRRDLTHVSDDELQKEWERLAEFNGRAEAEHAAIQEANYRHDYHELPETERLGKRGGSRRGADGRMRQEDLPDADGAMDPDKLAEHNKTVAEFNKSQIVRRARADAMKRIQEEQQRRESTGATAEPETVREVRETVPDVEALDLVKRGIDKSIENHLQKGSIDKAAAVKLTARLHEFLKHVDTAVPEYGKARSAYAAGERMREALEKGRAAVNQGDPRVIEREIAALETEHEKGLYRFGLQDALNQVIGKTRDGGQVAEKLAGSETLRRQLAAIAKDAPSADELLRRASEERLMAETDKRVLGNSSTAENVGGRKAIENAAGAEPEHLPASKTGVVRYLFGRVRAAAAELNPNTADAVANRLLAGTTDRAELMKALDEIDALRKKGKLTPAKTRELLRLPAAAQAGRVVSGSK